MDSGADSYRRYLAGEDEGLAEIVRAYKDGLILYLNGYVNDLPLAEELAEDTFFRLIAKRPGSPAAAPSNPGSTPSGGMWRWTGSGATPGW